MANATNTVDYQFDGAGRRTVVWQESNNLSIRGNVYWGSTPIALHGINGTEYFEQQDWLGTERVRTDYTGAVVGSYVSLAFGDGFSASGTDEDPYHFAGTDRDSESATDHAQFRQFREATGRWMSPDPYDGSYDWSDPQSYNRYAYVMGNPIASVDPSGLFTNGATDGGGGDGNRFAGLLANLVADAAEELFKALFGGASFHGSLNPRPTEGVDSNGTYAVYAGQIDYDYNISPRFGALIGAPSDGWSWDETPHWPAPAPRTQSFSDCFAKGWSQSQTLSTKAQVATNVISVAGIIFPNPISKIVGVVTAYYTFGSRVLPTAVACAAGAHF